MGLDTTHDCWHGGYRIFHMWRAELAKAANVPLELMDGFWEPADPASLAWAAPADGGPRCGHPAKSNLHRYIKKVEEWLPVQWNSLKPDVLHVLLNHSDCDGEIAVEYCTPLAGRLEELLPKLPGVWERPTRRFIEGLRRAARRREAVEFH